MIEHGLLLAVLLFGAEHSDSLALGNAGNLVPEDIELAMAQESNSPTLSEVLGRLRALERAGQFGTPALRHDLTQAVANDVGGGTVTAADALLACRDLDASSLLAVIDGFAASDAPDAATALARLLGQLQGMDVFILDAICRLARSTVGPRDESVLLAVRFALNSPDARERRAAAFAAGALGDDEAVETLIAMLDDENPLTASAAHGALVEHIGLPFASRSELWQSWYDEEEEFLEEEFDDQVMKLNGDDLALCVSATRLIAAGRLGREARARALLEVLPRVRDEGLELQMLSGLRTLGSEVARDLLTEYVEDDSRPALREAAQGALAALAPRGHGIAKRRRGR